jgi:hypothetical protein
MKTTVILIICLFSALLNGQEINRNPFGIKSGIVEYNYYGDKVGKGTLWFDNYGLKCAMYTELVSGSKTTKSWVVSTGGYQYMWESAKPTEGKKIKNPILIWANEAPEEGTESYNETFYENMGMKRGANETFLNRECKVLKGDIGKLLTWQGIIVLLDLKKDSHNTRQAASSIKTNVPVDAKSFRIPANVKFTEIQ